MKIKSAVIWSVFWICSAFAFSGLLYFYKSPTFALDFIAAYLIEKSLSIDNIFVFILIFSSTKTPLHLQPSIMRWGVIGALVMRALFIFAGVKMMEEFHWVTYFFGALLLFAGIKQIPTPKKEINTEKSFIRKTVGKFIRVTKDFHGGSFFVRQGGKLFATPLFTTLLTIEFTDLIFATDSIPAVLAVTPDTFIVYTSNIFAILGLRSLYFALGGALSKLKHLHYGLALILIFVGVKMLIANVYHISTLSSLAFICGALVLSGSLSLIVPQKHS